MQQDIATSRLTGRLLCWGLPLFYFLTSVGFYLHTYDSAQVKITIVQMLGTVLTAGFYVMVASRWTLDGSRYGPLAVPLLVSLLSGTVSWMLAAYPGNSLDEMLRRVFYVHMALIALFEIKTLERMRRTVKFLLAAVALASIYGLIQSLDFRFYQTPKPGWLDPFIWRQAFSDRVFSTFGNPNFFGNFLVILTPITLALLLRRQRERPTSVLIFSLAAILVSAILWQCPKIFGGSVELKSWENPFFMMLLMGFLFFAAISYSFLGVLFFLITLCVFLTFSKGAWVGYVGSYISFLGLVLFQFSQFSSDKVKRAIQSAGWLTMILMTIAVGYYSTTRADSLRFRLVTWTSTWEMAQMSPIIGNGIGSFRVLYPAFRRPQIFHIEGKHNTETDHAEDEYIEVLMDEGVVGFGIFLWLIVTFSTAGFRALGRFTQGLAIRDPTSGKKRINDDPRAYYMLGFLAAFWGMLMHNLMDVSLRFVSSGIFLWLLMGLIGALVIHDPMAETDDQLDAREPIPPSEPPSTLVMVGSSIVGVGYGYLAWIVLSEFNNAQGPLPPPFGEALLWLIAWVAFAGTVGAVLWGVYRICRSVRAAPVFLILLVALYPLKIFWGYFMADVHHNRGIFFSKQGKWEDAIKEYGTTVRLNPNYLMSYYFMGNVYTDRWGPGDFDRALEQYRLLWAQAPNYVQSKHQAGLVYLKKAEDDRRLWEDLLKQGKRAESDAALKRLMDDWHQALAYFQQYHDIDPVFDGNFSRAAWVHMRLGEVYNQMGRPADAQREFNLVEAQYKESLEAWGCRKPEHDMMGENWERTHRHYDRLFTADMWENLGNIRFMRGNLVGSERAYRQALRVNPTSDRVKNNLAAVRTKMHGR